MSFVGDTWPHQLRLRLTATVAEVIRNGSWNLPSARSQQSELLQIALTEIQPPNSELREDLFLWIQSNGSFGSTFSSKTTWDLIRHSSPPQQWHKVIWFKEHIPRNSFIAWLALLRRLLKRDRLRRWGMNVPDQCVLCSSAQETHHHLFFECRFSSIIWSLFAGRVAPNPPQDIHYVAAWINMTRTYLSLQARCIFKLIFQATIT